MEELEEIKQLRKQIREILLNSDELKNVDSLRKKNNFQQLKKDCYVKLVDVKNDFEKVQETPNNEDAIKKIDELMELLKQVRKGLGNQL